LIGVLAALGVAAGLLLAGASNALAAAANDNFAAATPIASLPFSDVADTTGTTTETGEPQFCNFVTNSVWYSITPSSDGTLSADTNGTPSPAQLDVYRQDGSGLGGLSFVGCQNFGPTPLVFPVAAGHTYYLQGSTLFGFTGSLHVNVAAVVPPANDDFAAAAPITSVPFADSPDLTAASVEPGEPSACGGSGRTVWYAFTPTATDSYSTSAGGRPVAVYTGGSLATLTQVACGQFSPAIFHANAGTTYYVQLSNSFGPSGPAPFSLTVAPAAMASFFYYPSDPSSFDTIQFFDTSYDPAGIASEAWAFGGGATATGCCPAHRYTADGDYAASLAITTTDGRTASATQTIHVRTHDVTIAKLTVPQTARVGQTRQLTVGLTDTRYPETVQVALLRSVPGGGFESVGQVTQTVPVRTGGRTTSATISYTFGPADATFGKVTFEAVATILGARDANPDDNTVIALPTKVNG
jgi:hypothetical protein